MRTLQITFYPLGTQLSLVKREFIPRLITDDLVVFNQELNPALLTTKTTMCCYYFVRLNTGIEPQTS